MADCMDFPKLYWKLIFFKALELEFRFKNLSFFSPTLAITYLKIGVYLNRIIKLVAVMAKNSMVYKGRSGRIQEKSIVEAVS